MYIHTFETVKPDREDILKIIANNLKVHRKINLSFQPVYIDNWSRPYRKSVVKELPKFAAYLESRLQKELTAGTLSNRCRDNEY